MKILLVEDDLRIAKALAEALEDKQYLVDLATDGQTGWDLMETFDYDLILLDIMLPKIDGICLCQRLRKKGSIIPVLMLTAKDTSEDKVMGLDVGADDYVVKPFDLAELMARIRALLRRNSSSKVPILEWGQLSLDPSNNEVMYGGQKLHLTPKEYGLLELFLRNSHQILTRSLILDHLWPFDDPPTEDAIKVHVKELRKKLKLLGAPPDLIETVYGVGYRLKQN
jgi:DNA-binding response OmpR family regulator